MCSAHIATRTAPATGLYLPSMPGCRNPGSTASRRPDVSRFAPAEPPRPARGAVDRAAALSRARAGHHVRARIAQRANSGSRALRLAERLGACVVT
jgi:hypothetical protein